MLCIYGVLEGYIQRYSPETEVIFRPRLKKVRPEGTALPEGIFLPRTKNDRINVPLSVYGLERFNYRTS